MVQLLDIDSCSRLIFMMSHPRHTFSSSHSIFLLCALPWYSLFNVPPAATIGVIYTCTNKYFLIWHPISLSLEPNTQKISNKIIEVYKFNFIRIVSIWSCFAVSLLNEIYDELMFHISSLINLYYTSKKIKKRNGKSAI